MKRTKNNLFSRISGRKIVFTDFHGNRVSGSIKKVNVNLKNRLTFLKNEKSGAERNVPISIEDPDFPGIRQYFKKSKNIQNKINIAKAKYIQKIMLRNDINLEQEDNENMSNADVSVFGVKSKKE